MEDRVADEGVALSILTPRRSAGSAVWAWSITSRFVAAVCSSNSKLDTREVKKLNGMSEKMAMPRPHAVAMSASAIPPVTACTANSSLPRKLNDRINPVTVPNKPSNGASPTRDRAGPLDLDARTPLHRALQRRFLMFQAFPHHTQHRIARTAAKPRRLS